ncbi:hypothetical protein B0H21DRAFT_751451 [Amylocystis lapponica]|nr:hypothetical protein B0H21DRAFT_751451 [Amylocystis lapponica]
MALVPAAVGRGSGAVNCGSSARPGWQTLVRSAIHAHFLQPTITMSGLSKVVFVGNVPYNMGEEQLIDVFKTVGQVVGFRYCARILRALCVGSAHQDLPAVQTGLRQRHREAQRLWIL